MIRNATVSAYDVLGDVWIAAQVQTREPNGEDFDITTWTASVQVRGTGEPETERWLRDALIALAETL